MEVSRPSMNSRCNAWRELTYLPMFEAPAGANIMGNQRTDMVVAIPSVRM